jgi:two-component system, sensor histidine kinase YesM
MLKNLVIFLVPLLVPIIVLGTLSILITQHYVKQDLNQKNWSLLKQTKDSLELILNEMDTLTLSFQTNQNITVRLKSILAENTLTYENNLSNDLIYNFLSAPANARSFIHSIYVYYDNPTNRVLTSTQGITPLESFYDLGWFISYMKTTTADTWLEERSIDRYHIEKTRVISIYQKLYSAGATRSNGVIVLNLYPGYIETMMESVILSNEQTMLIIDSNHHPLFQVHPVQITSSDLERITNTEEQQQSIELNGKLYTLFFLKSERYGLTYISIIPQSVLYEVPIRLTQNTVTLLIVSLLVGVFITYFLTLKNYNNLRTIISIITSAEQGKPIPLPSNQVTDEYSFILQNVIRTFVEQSYLKTQLSERTFKLRFMEMLALQSQINPHFLYNTLETIYWKVMAITGRPNEANIMLEHLSDILKYAFDHPQHEVILEQEIRYTEIYLDIQKIRNKDKFDVIWEIDDNTRHVTVLKLILQPLVENSIYHGIKEKQTKCQLKIRIFRHSQYIHIAVIDTGKGMTRDRLKAVRRTLEIEYMDSEGITGNIGDRNSGIGLRNTNKRLQLSYGNEYGLRIASKSGWGTKVEIIIPAYD